MNKVVENKTYKKRKIPKIGDRVLYISSGEEPIEGVLINVTEYKGEKIFQVDIESLNVKKWGSIKQIVSLKKEENNEEI